MIHPDGFAGDPAFKFGGKSVIDTSKASSTTATARAGSPAAR